MSDSVPSKSRKTTGRRRCHQFFQLAVHLRGIGDGRHGVATASHRDLGEVGDDGVGARRQQFAGISVPLDTDDEAEAAVPAGPDAGFVTVDNHAANGANP